jgi:hypothetical protein
VAAAAGAGARRAFAGGGAGVGSAAGTGPAAGGVSAGPGRPRSEFPTSLLPGLVAFLESATETSIDKVSEC